MAPHLKAAIYARYSSELQHARSVDDQIETCRGYAEREGMTVVSTFADHARTGASILSRDGLLELMQAAKARKFQALIVESLDRVSRDQADLHGLFKRLQFYGVEIRTISEGETTEMHVALRGLIGQQFNKDLAMRVRRGHAGRVREGKIPGAIPYGYRRVPGRPGEPEIDPETALVVKRIFSEYAAGRSPREIANALTAEGIPSPAGGIWNHQTFVGGRGEAQKKGLISNRLYIGEVHWNRLRSVRDPDSGKVLKRVAPKAEHLLTDAPQYRIIDQKLWDAAQRVLAARSVRANGAGKHPAIRSRSTSILSGIVHCATCSEPMVIGQNSRNGVGRFVCRAAYLRSACEHTKSYDSARLEQSVLAGLGEQLASEEALSEFVAAYRDERRALERKARSDLTQVRRRLSDIDAATLRLVNALERASMPEAVIVDRLQALETERAGLEERARLAEEETNVVSLHPQAIARFQTVVRDLQAALSRPEISMEARLAFGNLVDRVVVIPTRKRMPYEVEIYGRLAAIAGINTRPSVRSAHVIAGEHGVSCSDSVQSEKSVSS